MGAIIALIAGAASASTFNYPATVAGTVTAPAIVEGSGLVVSPDNPGVLWTENDSGNPNTIFALDTAGHLLGTYYLDGVTNYDWEDMSVGPGPEPGVNYLYLANSASHESANQSIVVRVPEPTVYAAQQVASPVTVHLSGTQSQTFNWAAATPNAETMFVDRQNGDLYLGSKQNNVTIIDRATQSQFSASGTQTMTQIGSVPLNKGNGASISLDGRQIIVRNQGNTALLYHRSAGQTVAQALTTQPDSIRINGTDVEPNAESIAFDVDGNNFYTFSEGTNQKLYLYTRTSNDAPPAHTSLLSPAATWKYLDGGTIPAANWNQPGFNDSSWSSGSGPFGYGQGGEHTVLSYGTSPNSKPASDVFRTTFTIAGNPHLLTDLTLKLLVDDGAAVYLNGTQIERFNLADNAALTTYAQSSISNAFQNSWHSFSFDRNLLVSGTNTLAIEVHGASATDADLRFDAQISALPVTPAPGDFNLDGHLDTSDIASMLTAMTNLSAFQSNSGLTPTQASTIADENHDGTVNNADIQAFLNVLRSGGGTTTPVPEPSAIVLALSAFIRFWRAAKRAPSNAIVAASTCNAT
jgi:hypothetical protein